MNSYYDLLGTNIVIDVVYNGTSEAKYEVGFNVSYTWTLVFLYAWAGEGGAALVERERFMYPEPLDVKIFYLANKVQDHRDKSLHTNG